MAGQALGRPLYPQPYVCHLPSDRQGLELSRGMRRGSDVCLGMQAHIISTGCACHDAFVREGDMLLLSSQGNEKVNA